MTEEWRQVKRMEGYEVSDLGGLRRKNKTWPYTKSEYNYPKPRYTKRGYHRAHNGEKDYLVHRLVLEAFVGPCPEGKECDHINRKKADNRVVNLRWVTRSENMKNIIYVFTPARQQNLVKARAALARKRARKLLINKNAKLTNASIAG